MYFECSYRARVIVRILFATDFSPYSAAAREHALVLARALGASVKIVHAIEPIRLPDDDEDTRTWRETLRDDLQRKLDDEVARFTADGIAVDGALRSGTPWIEILDDADAEDASLIVVGGHGLTTGEGRVLIGTTSHKVALSSRRPVLVVPRPESTDQT